MRRRRPTAPDLVERRQGLPRVHVAQLCAEAGEYFDGADRVSDDDRGQ